MSLFQNLVFKIWKTIGFSPGLAGKTGISSLGLMIINGIIRWKMILKKKRLFNIM